MMKLCKENKIIFKNLEILIRNFIRMKEFHFMIIIFKYNKSQNKK
jgi:hypothetical protein